MSESVWAAFWTNLPYLVGALGTCVVPGVTAWLLMKAHRENRAEARATREQVAEVGVLVKVATENVEKIEKKTNSMHDKIVELTDKEAAARGHRAGKAEGVAEEKDRQAGGRRTEGDS